MLTPEMSRAVVVGTALPPVIPDYVEGNHLGGRVTNAVGTIFRNICVGTRARPI